MNHKFKFLSIMSKDILINPLWDICYDYMACRENLLCWDLDSSTDLFDIEDIPGEYQSYEFLTTCYGEYSYYHSIVIYYNRLCVSEFTCTRKMRTRSICHLTENHSIFSIENWVYLIRNLNIEYCNSEINGPFDKVHILGPLCNILISIDWKNIYGITPKLKDKSLSLFDDIGPYLKVQQVEYDD